ncbi:Dolichyl-diphosphooligosaccharide--protein glycosyltransferase subunit WBP1 [Kickxella alabastrina]|uniref:Dolichyl-diphosphooligosaccharide--protein glycosyltransferase subunit WBP1 n=1 Tax=Kickxella alabastrina TaxID=61397 RepID=UPI00221E5AF5|nr:Dolichyl-diphosphooligosaccharide--protein glycosyltransferase subunit WBP1 [Kickxella alabastrina]KAI7830028.1 Dolichyl-diphosphooligosaccharide--protein glycosyltransferase subunit WBP1 [Kickxella alabastrina]
MRLLPSLGICLALGGAWLKAVDAKSATGDRVLVLVPTTESAKQYTHFLGTLETRGFDISVRAASNSSVALHLDGERLYDHAILLSQFIRFVDDGGNLLVAASSELSDFHRKLGAQFGVEFEKRGSRAIDHVSHLSENGSDDHSVVAAHRFFGVPAVLPSLLAERIRYCQEPAACARVGWITTTYSGNAATGGDSDNKALSPMDTPLSGKALGLVSVFQTRSNARVAFSGSTELSNTQFVAEVSKWVLQEKSVLRETGHRHHLLSTGEKPEYYRIGNEMVYEIDLSVYRDDAWHPYVANDVQFEAIMLDPYVRLTLNRTLSTDSKSPMATYRGDIKLPDRYGTFTFRVNYKRTGYSNVDVKDTVAIWPLRHDEYPRFLTAAYPYYTSSFVMIIGFLALSAAWLWNAEPRAKANIKDEGKTKAKNKTKQSATSKPKSN